MPAIPPVPRPIIDAGLSGGLVLFIGAGTSRQAGCPSWEKLAQDALSELCEQGIITYADKELLTTHQNLTPKAQLSIAVDLAQSNKYTLNIKKLIQPHEALNKCEAVYTPILNFNCPIITTNYDDLIEVTAKNTAAFDRTGATEEENATRESVSPPKKRNMKAYIRPSDLSVAKLLKPETLIYLHGKLDDDDSIIMTAREYIDHYNKNEVTSFLSESFSKHVFLFIGYGLSEIEIIENILRKVDSGNQKKSDQKEGRHYWLYPKYNFQDKMNEHLRTFYRQHYNVEIVPYSLDDEGHKVLIKVLEQWSEEVDFREAGLAEKASLVDKAFSDENE